MIEKKDLRKIMMQLRNEMASDVKAELDRNICEKLGQIIKLRNPRFVHSYLPMGSEVDVLPLLMALIENGVTVIAPKTLPARRLENLVLKTVTDIEAGMWGTMHPSGGNVYTGKIDLFIIPGLAFDPHCYRLGYGAGYYDSHLITQTTAYKVGICYPFQVIEKVPIEPHDVRLDEIIY